MDSVSATEYRVRAALSTFTPGIVRRADGQPLMYTESRMRPALLIPLPMDSPMTGPRKDTTAFKESNQSRKRR